MGTLCSISIPRPGSIYSRPDSLLRLWRYINYLLTYSINGTIIDFTNPVPLKHVRNIHESVEVFHYFATVKHLHL